jgi:propionyl-CoA carboxylase alpha chain
MFSKILIANRGEIACRIIRTARRMGIATVAVYSRADRFALHVRLADEAVLLGPAPPAESYLHVDRILSACRKTGAEAVHPGYGFLSENAAFARRVAAEGMTFIGPEAEAIELMGDKIVSKELAGKAGVSTIPGSEGAVEGPEEAVEAAKAIGYPVMLKASAGGGGKGMRIVRSDAECLESFERVVSEAKSSFGDSRVLLEKYISSPRHIEIQVLADGHGQVIHLGERECSLQRRHQKVIEEAPSTFIDPETRAAMGAQAVTLARAVGYRSAGTVEFVVDDEKKFYFLEMNTRLQVEHPVTELVTGLDLVEQMIRIAAGEKLALTQEEIAPSGWAMEARIYAEDPFRNFLPSSGRLVRFIPPEENRFVRVDTGVFEGGEASVFYDPMIAKLVTFGATREEAGEHLRQALDEFTIRGIAHNISFLSALVTHPRFIEGDFTTDFIAEEYPRGFHPADVPHDDPEIMVAIAASIHRRHLDRNRQISGQMPGHERQVGDDWVVLLDGVRHDVKVLSVKGGHDVVIREGIFAVRSDWRFGLPVFRGTVNSTSLSVQVHRNELHYRLTHSGSEVNTILLSPRAADLYAHMPKKKSRDQSTHLLSPMPGLLISVDVESGQKVKAGEKLAVIEAMKMENTLFADHEATVASVLVAPGDSLCVNQPILEFR